MGGKVAIRAIICIAVILIPYILTLVINGSVVRNSSILKNVSSGKDIVIYQDGRNVLVDMEVYVAHTLPGLIDYESDMELIKAQAVAVRGKINYAMGEERVINSEQLEFTYFTNQDFIDKFGRENYKKALMAYETAVFETLGECK